MEEEVLLEQTPEVFRRVHWHAIFIIPLILAFLRSKQEKLKITENRIIFSQGILSNTQMELPKEKVQQVMVDQGLIDRMLNVGAISITTGGDLSEIEMYGFANPEKIKKLCRH